MDDWEQYDEDEVDGEDDSNDVVPCPSCNADIYEDAEQCPVCGMYVVRSTSAWSDRPLWWIALGALGLIATILALALA